MVEIEKAKKEFVSYVDKVKINSPRAQMKFGHIMRVSKNCKRLATDLGLTEEKIQLAELIGLLHDIGRFEQYKIVDQTKKFDHGEAGVEILKKDNYIRKYIEENKYDDIIYTAIYEHNQYELTEGLTKEEELFSKIIKDADKIDILYESIYIYWQDAERIQKVEEGKLSKKMLENFYQHKLADSRNKMSETDQILRYASFVFDINFPCSFKILKENDNVSKMIDRFHYQVPETKAEMMEVKKIAKEYISNKVKNNN